KLGRSGRSISRQVRMASSLGRPSRRKNEPGIRPAAYMRSSTSTVSGKKSSCSRADRLAVVAESTTVSPSWATAEPAAWRASRPPALRSSPRAALPGRLPAQTEPLDQGAVPADVGALQIVEQPAPPADEQQQPAPAVVVMLVGTQVLGQVGDSLAEHRHLDL